jgi:hypothetical protein
MDPATLPDGTKVQTRGYLGGSGALENGVGQEGVAFQITTGASSPVRYDSTAIGLTGKALVERFRTAGAKNVGLVDQHDGDVRGYPSRTYRLRFTQPANGLKSDPVVWFVCEIAAGPAFVVVQTIQFPPKGHGAEVLARERQVQEHAIASLEFP